MLGGRRRGENSYSVSAEILLIADVRAIASYMNVQPGSIETFTSPAASPYGHDFSMTRNPVDFLGVLERKASPNVAGEHPPGLAG